MKRYILNLLHTAATLAIFGMSSAMVAAAEITISGDLQSIAISGTYSHDITTPYTGASGEMFAMADIKLQGAITSTLILDTAAERAIVLGLISNLATGQGASLTGESVSTCGVVSMSPITLVTFN